MVGLYLDLGASVNVSDMLGKTPLAQATESLKDATGERAEKLKIIIQMLKDHGATE